MRIAVLGATGKVGTRVVAEAEARGHTTTKIRNPKSQSSREETEGIRYASILDADQIAQAVEGADAVVVAVHLDMADESVGFDDPAVHRRMADAILSGVEQGGIRQLVIVGGSGSLLVAPGVMYALSPIFPSIYYRHASAQTHGWEYIRDAETPVDWSYVCPAFRIHLDPGERTGKFRLGGEYMLVDDEGLSRISYEDLAVAVVDELEDPKHVRQMFTLAY